MSGRNKQLRRQWWLFLIRPSKACRAHFEGGSAAYNLLVIFHAGFVLVQLWATFFHLGDHYPTGKIMTVTLILGPVAGLMLAAFGTSLCLSLGNLLDPNHRPRYTYREQLPPFPLKKFLWHRVLGREKVADLLRKGPLGLYTRAWSWTSSGLNHLFRQLSGGRVRYGQVFSVLSAYMSALLPLGIILVVELAMGDGSHFTSQGGSSVLWLVVKALFVVWFFVLWYPMVREGFQLSAPRALLASALAVVLSLGLVLLLMTMVFQLPVFGG